MKRILAALLVLASSGLARAQVVGKLPDPGRAGFIGYVPDELIVVLDAEARRDIHVARDAFGRPRVDRPFLQGVFERQDVRAFDRQFASARPQPKGSKRPDLTGYYTLRLGPGRDLDAAVRELEASPGVDHVERIGMHALYQEPDDPYYKVSPNPDFPYDQWALYASNGIDAEHAWGAETGSPDVLVGVLDTGTRYFHVDLGGNVPAWGPANPSLSGNIFVNGAEIPGNGVDDDGNGYVDDTIGWDFVTSTGGYGVRCADADCSGADNDPDDGDGHGTHVAGTIAAITNNGTLVSGVAGGFSDGSGDGNGVKIVPLRIGYHALYQGGVTGIVRMDWAAQAMNYVADLVDAGHDVAAINCSWSSSDSGGLGAAVDNLLAHDVLIVHAAGNSGVDSPDFLGTKDGVLNVAATDRTGGGASFTNHGAWVDVAAPGVDILSLYRNPDDRDPSAHYIAVLSGTSMATPHVVGIAALLESCSPALSRSDKFDLIRNNTDAYRDSRLLGSGIANASKALAAAGCGTPCDLVAGFVGTPSSGCGPLTVDFTDLSAGSVAGWTWDFGDGSASREQHPTHEYTAPGDYTVSLTVSNRDCSNTASWTAYVRVSSAPIADFSASPASGVAPLGVSFTDLSGGTPTTWSWDFGDGGSSSAQHPVHAYAAAGSYDVTLTASNACGSDVVTKVGVVNVSEPVPSSLHVASITVAKQNVGSGAKQGVATVEVVDQDGTPVAGALVTGNFSGKTNDTGVTGTTDASGRAVLSSSAARGGGSWCFAVTDVSGPMPHASSDDVVTSACD